MRWRFKWWPGDSSALAPAADATKAEQVPAAERVVIAQRTPARSALVAAAMLGPPICPIDVAGVGAGGDAQLRIRVIALRIGDAGLAGRKAVAGLVQPSVNGTGI
jgi:hypothetical protein